MDEAHSSLALDTLEAAAACASSKAACCAFKNCDEQISSETCDALMSVQDSFCANKLMPDAKLFWLAVRICRHSMLASEGNQSKVVESRFSFQQCAEALCKIFCHSSAYIRGHHAFTKQQSAPWRIQAGLLARYRATESLCLPTHRILSALKIAMTTSSFLLIGSSGSYGYGSSQS